MYAVFLKTKKIMHNASAVSFYFELYLNTCSKEIYSFIWYYKKEKEVCAKYFLFKVFCCFSQTPCQKNVLMIAKTSYCFVLDKAKIGESTLCQKDSSAPLLNPFRIRNNTVYGYVNLKNNIWEFQRSEVPIPVGVILHVNELQEGDGSIQNLNKGKTKWYKNCVLELSASN